FELLLKCGKRFLQRERMLRLAFGATAQLLGKNLANPELRLWLDGRAHRLRRRGGDRMVERARRAGRQHFHSGDVARASHLFFGQVAGERQQKAVYSIFKKVAVGQALEESVPVV